jgi:hypothetical protein
MRGRNGVLMPSRWGATMSDHNIDDTERTLEYWVDACGAMWPDVVTAAGAETSYRSIIFRHSTDSVRVFYGETPPAWALATLAHGVEAVAAESGSLVIGRVRLVFYIERIDEDTGLPCWRVESGDDVSAWLAAAKRLWGGGDE